MSDMSEVDEAAIDDANDIRDKEGSRLDDVTLERMGLRRDGIDYVHEHMSGWSFGCTLGKGDSAYADRPLPERILMQVWDAGIKLGEERKANEIKRALMI